MARLLPIALLASLTSVSAAAQTAPNSDSWRIPNVNFVERQALELPGTTLGANGRLGLGMYGFKTEQARQRAVIAREIDAPRQRRAGVGFSLKF